MGDDFPVDKQTSTNTLTFQKPSPITRLSPRYNGSILYDSYELQAVTRQINKAMQASIGSSPPYLSYLKLPFYRHRLDCIYKANEKTPRRICSSVEMGATNGKKVNIRGKKYATAGFVIKLWNKVKQGLLRNKQKI